ncbi:hypothetical protein BDW59DRAFT_174311 [Aspergillus cavernicola]|uniref:Geranylgeranyl pyrophosphate synthetase n=1 Tax=Aspergillus cavernicola TaxID=176166 RepID=A0ABR4HZR4_9EURO
MMASSKVAEISRSDLRSLGLATTKVTNVKHLSSYNWVDTSAPTIAIPGSPPLWSPPEAAQQLKKDSGLIYIAQNAARHPDSPLEPLFRALYVSDPSFDIHSVDIVTDRNNIRKLLSFVNPSLSRGVPEPFTIDVEVLKNTAMFCRAETKAMEYVGPHEFTGFGHEFEKAYTTNQLDGSTGHHRIISYQFGDMKLIVRHETDGYIHTFAKTPIGAEGAENPSLSSMLESLSLGSSESYSHTPPIVSKLVIKEDGQAVPIESTLEIKTRVSHKPIKIKEVLPQLWVSQTPNLVRAYHKNGLFEQPQVENVTLEIQEWEEEHQTDLRQLSTVIQKIIEATRKCGGNATIKYDTEGDKLVVWKVDRRTMLPNDLYSKLDNTSGTKLELIKSLNETSEPKPSRAAIKIGDVFFDVDLTTIPYLASFVQNQHATQPGASEYVHSPIPLFDTALKGITSGFRQCFRSLPADLSQYHTLCGTYHLLRADVLERQSINDIFADLRSCKLDYDDYGPIRGNKSAARDAAFRLLFLILQMGSEEKQRDSNKVYNAVLFVVSHPGTFKWRTRTVVRAAYEEQFMISPKQRVTLSKWESKDQVSDDDNTTEDEFEDYFYYSDDS